MYCLYRRLCKEKKQSRKWKLKHSRKSTRHIMSVHRHKAMLMRVTKSEVSFDDGREEEESTVETAYSDNTDSQNESHTH